MVQPQSPRISQQAAAILYELILRTKYSKTLDKEKEKEKEKDLLVVDDGEKQDESSR